MRDGAGRGSLGILFTILLVVMMGFSILFPVLPKYAARFGATGFSLSLLGATYSAMQFVFSPLWGRLSDRIGRRPVLMIGLAGFALSFGLMGLARSLGQLFLARALAGILSSATLPTAMAYIGDTTAGEHRARGMGLMGAAFGLGVIVGPAVGGFLVRYGLNSPFFAAAALAAAMLVAAALFLPESHRPGRGAARAGRRASRLGALRGRLGALLLVSFAVSAAVAGLENVFGIFALQQLGLEPQQQWWLFVAMGAVGTVVQGGLVGPATRRFGEARLLQWGLLGTAGGFVALTGARDAVTAALYLAVFTACSGFVRPATAALVSRGAGDRQGTYIGLMDSFDSLGRVLGPPLAGFLYDRAPAYTWWLGAGLSLLAAGLFAAAGRREQAEAGRGAT